MSRILSGGRTEAQTILIIPEVDPPVCNSNNTTSTSNNNNNNNNNNNDTL